MADNEKKKYSDVDLSKYDSGYQKSADVIAADQKKAEAEKAVSNYGDFAYSNDSAFKNAMDKILNREKFSYDLNGDALYQQYKDKYIQQGKMAMQDTMGQAAAMTGGYGNSYAASVGNQAYQASLENLNDIVPELYQMAYDKYNQEGQDLYNQYAMLSDDRNMEYGMWGDKRNQLLTDRDYYGNEANNAFSKDYGLWADERDFDANKYWNETNFGYGQERDAVADSQWKAQFDEAKRQYDEQMTFQKEQAEKSSSGISLNHVASMSSSELVSALEGYQLDGNDAGLASFLDDCIYTGRLTQEQALEYYEKYKTAKGDDTEDDKTDTTVNRGGGGGGHARPIEIAYKN